MTFLNETFYITIAYKSHPYSEALTMKPAVSYIPNAIYYCEQTGYIITFAQFKGGGYCKMNVI